MRIWPPKNWHKTEYKGFVQKSGIPVYPKMSIERKWWSNPRSLGGTPVFRQTQFADRQGNPGARLGSEAYAGEEKMVDVLLTSDAAKQLQNIGTLSALMWAHWCPGLGGIQGTGCQRHIQIVCYKAPEICGTIPMSFAGYTMHSPKFASYIISLSRYRCNHMRIYIYIHTYTSMLLHVKLDHIMPYIMLCHMNRLRMMSWILLAWIKCCR